MLLRCMHVMWRSSCTVHFGDFLTGSLQGTCTFVHMIRQEHLNTQIVIPRR